MKGHPLGIVEISLGTCKKSLPLSPELLEEKFGAFGVIFWHIKRWPDLFPLKFSHYRGQRGLTPPLCIHPLPLWGSRRVLLKPGKWGCLLITGCMAKFSS
jgi:hypothetical protein